MKKGLIFTLDAILALIVASSLILASFNYVSQTQVAWNRPTLLKISLNSLAVLELSQTLQEAVKTSDAVDVEEFLNNLLPDNVCARVEFYDEADSLLMTAAKSGCASSNYPTVSYQGLSVSGDIYYARMEAWYI